MAVKLLLLLMVVVRDLGMMLRQKITGGDIPTRAIMSKMFKICSTGAIFRRNCGGMRNGPGS